MFTRTLKSIPETVWKFVLLGLAFVCLLVGFLLLGMGAMASRCALVLAEGKREQSSLAS